MTGIKMHLNAQLEQAVEPPIAEAQSWVAGRSFAPDLPLLDLCQAVPSYPPAPALRAHLAAKAELFATAQYTAIRGLPHLRQALAAHMAGFYGGSISAEDVLISAGCNQAFCLAMMALAGKGDEVILPVPHYFNHKMWLDMTGVCAVDLPFRADRGGVPDPEQAATLITPRTRAIVLVTPNNPTGAIYPPAVIAGFADLCRRHGLALVIDETYKDFVAPDGARHRLFSDPNWRDTVVQLYSFSKVFSLTGYRVGSLIAGPAVIAAVTKVMDTISICAPHIGQEAAFEGLSVAWDWVAEKRQMLDRRRAALTAIFAADELGYELISAGAYFAYVRHPFAGVAARTVAENLARNHNLLCLPGSFFGAGQEDCLRLAYANALTEQMPEVAKRLRENVLKGGN
jgi:aspartate/methionine/tyrosine aminotransferase